MQALLLYELFERKPGWWFTARPKLAYWSFVWWKYGLEWI